MSTRNIKITQNNKVSKLQRVHEEYSIDKKKVHKTARPREILK